MSDAAAPPDSGASGSPAPRRPPNVAPATRLRYLRAAAELAGRTDPGQDTFPYAVSRVTMANVAAAMGVARTTLYKLWPSKFDFWADLTTYIATRQPEPTADSVAEAILAADTTALPPVMEQMRIVLNDLQASQRRDPRVALRTALLGYAGDARVERLLRSATEREIDDVSAHLEHLLFALGVTPIEPLTARDIAAVGFCVLDGLTTAGRITPLVNDTTIALDDGPPGWGLLAFAMRGIIRRCTRARRDGDPEPPAFRSPAPLDDGDRWSPAQLAALDVGARQFEMREQPGSPARPAGPLGHVTLARLARHAGVSRQTLHRIWPSQQAFASDLVIHLYDERCEAVLRTVRQATRQSMAVPFGGALVATEFAMRRFVADATSGPLSHLAYAAHDDDQHIREHCRRTVESMLERFGADLAALTSSWGGSTRDGVTFVHLASLIVLTELAAARLERISPGLLRRGLPHRGGHWSTTAIMVEGIVGYALGLPIDEHPVVLGPGEAL